jgi:hypothetical protein
MSLNVQKAKEFYFDDTKFTNPDNYTKKLLSLIRESLTNENIEDFKLLDMLIGDHIQSGRRIDEGEFYFRNKGIIYYP